MPLDYQSELFYLVDEHDNVLGSVARKKAHAEKLNHRSIYIIVKNSKDQILFQKRSSKKDTHPYFWTLSVGGHVTYPDTYLETAKKELKEELGINLPLKFIKKIYLKEPTEFCHVYLAKTDKTPTKFDKDEISQVKWVDIDGLDKFVEENKVTPASKQTLEDMEIRNFRIYP